MLRFLMPLAAVVLRLQVALWQGARVGAQRAQQGEQQRRRGRSGGSSSSEAGAICRGLPGGCLRLAAAAAAPAGRAAAAGGVCWAGQQRQRGGQRWPARVLLTAPGSVCQPAVALCHKPCKLCKLNLSCLPFWHQDMASSGKTCVQWGDMTHKRHETQAARLGAGPPQLGSAGGQPAVSWLAVGHASKAAMHAF